jgi:hypothetical protein
MNDKEVLEVLRSSSRALRTREIGTRLRQASGLDLPKTEVNAALLRLQQQNLARMSRGNRWVANREESTAAPSHVSLEERPREVLREQMAQRGLKIARNRKLCSGLLRDLCPEVEFRPHVHVLTAAFDAGIPAELLAAAGGSALTAKLLRGRLVKRLQTDQGLSAVLATWVVEAWERAIAAGRAAP